MATRTLADLQVQAHLRVAACRHVAESRWLPRSTVRTRKDLLTHRIGLGNQLRAPLEFCYPGPVGLFADLDAVTNGDSPRRPISLS